MRISAISTSDSEVKATTIPGKASTSRSEATLGRVIISEVMSSVKQEPRLWCDFHLIIPPRM